jgi:hypothetical protein
MGYQYTTSFGKTETGDMSANSNTSNMWKNYFPQSLNVNIITGFRQMAVYTAESLVS